jgi:hypothetical protein
VRGRASAHLLAETDGRCCQHDRDTENKSAWGLVENALALLEEAWKSPSVDSDRVLREVAGALMVDDGEVVDEFLPEDSRERVLILSGLLADAARRVWSLGGDHGESVAEAIRG